MSIHENAGNDMNRTTGTSEPWDDPIAVRESVDAVETRVFARLPKRTRRRRMIRVAGAIAAAIGLFAGGMAVGATAYASGPLRSSNNVFFITCYGTPRATNPWTWVNYNNNADDPATDRQVAKAKARPGASCLPSFNQEIAGKAMEPTLVAENKAGHTCGVISAPGMPAFYFATAKNGALYGYSYSDRSMTTQPLSENCVSVVLPQVTLLKENDLGACKVDRTHVNVYVLGKYSEAAVCALHHLSRWTS
jgi:hypothetical protein